MDEYKRFFKRATGVEPYAFQIRLAKQEAADQVVVVPTGAGKTASVIVGWLWRLARAESGAPRRLVYCLPMRTLTAQTAEAARRYVKNLGLKELVGVHVLMGGDLDRDESWQAYPEKPTIIVGTEDMILSRLLNRGYAMNPLRWPVPFGLLANDATWVFDEVQLLGDGLATSLQLQAFRQELGTFGICQSIWMSATCRTEWLETVDHPGPTEASVTRLGEDDRRQLNKRLTANKTLQPAPEECRSPKGLAAFVLEKHKPGTLTLVVTNTVARATETYIALQEGRGLDGAEIDLLHSRYRPIEREARSAVLTKGAGKAGRIVVATQVIEAGVDISAALMVTDAAPYASLVQRFGRVNRGGEFQEAFVYWVDRPVTGKMARLAQKEELKDKDIESIARPYAWADLERARVVIQNLTSASPADLPEIEDGFAFEHVLRRRDVIDLFDTTPDLGGNDVDVSRFIRGGDERDVFVAWRAWADPKVGPEKNELSRLDTRELCSVPLGQFRDFLRERGASSWTWRPTADEWEQADRDRLAPGMRLVLHASAGGYSVNTGWNPESLDPVPPVAEGLDGEFEESVDDDPLTERPRRARYQQTLTAHVDRVVEEAERILNASTGILVKDYGGALLRAARFHDWGKAHPEFQKTLHKGEALPSERLLAKSCHMGKHERRHLRHELASALGLLEHGEDDLVAYLVATHHGRIRLTVRSMPDERDESVVRGVSEGDMLPAVDLGGGVMMPQTVLRLEVARLGSAEDGMRSWGERMTRLRDQIGPFRLAYLEALLRAADERASAEPGKDCEACPE